MSKSICCLSLICASSALRVLDQVIRVRPAANKGHSQPPTEGASHEEAVHRRGVGGCGHRGASEHRIEPPRSAEHLLDPTADNTDTYAFTAKGTGALTVVANWIPGEVPANGPNFFRFDDRARYYIHIDNDGDGKPDVSYRFVFDSKVNPDSYLQAFPGVESINDPKLYQRQTYDIIRETYGE